MPDTVKVKIAPGRSLVHGVTKSSGQGDQKRTWSENKRLGPGDEIELPADDAAELMKAGYLVDPNAEPPPLPQGARVGMVSSERR